MIGGRSTLEQKLREIVLKRNRHIKALKLRLKNMAERGNTR